MMRQRASQAGNDWRHFCLIAQLSTRYFLDTQQGLIITLHCHPASHRSVMFYPSFYRKTRQTNNYPQPARVGLDPSFLTQRSPPRRQELFLAAGRGREETDKFLHTFLALIFFTKYRYFYKTGKLLTKKQNTFPCSLISNYMKRRLYFNLNGGNPTQ